MLPIMVWSLKRTEAKLLVKSPHIDFVMYMTTKLKVAHTYTHTALW